MADPVSLLLPDTKKLVQPRALSRWGRTFGELDPRTITSIMREVEQGDVTNWTDLCHFIIRTDPHVAAVYGTRTSAVAGAEWSIQPAMSGDPLAEAGAEACRAMLERVEETERVFADLLHGIGLGWALFEHKWTRVNGRWQSSPVWIHPRECKFEKDWTLSVRTEVDGSFVRTSDHPGKFIVHIPRTLTDAPNVSGVLLTIVWSWFFKRWFEKFQYGGLEKFANPFLFGEVPPNSPDNVRSDLRKALEGMSADQVAVFEQGTGVRVAEISGRVGDTWQAAIDARNNEITKGLLGSTLNTDVGDSGSRALGESQANATILPRSMSDAKRLAGTIERDWFTPYLKYNMSLFGGRVPPTPKMCFELYQEPPANIDQLIVDVGAVTVDELRAARGLEPWGQERGGDRVATVPEKVQAPMFSHQAPSEVGTPRPLSKTSLSPLERTLLGLHTERAISPISTHSSPTVTAPAPSSKSVAPVKRPSARRSKP